MRKRHCFFDAMQPLHTISPGLRWHLTFFERLFSEVSAKERQTNTERERGREKLDSPIFACRDRSGLALERCSPSTGRKRRRRRGVGHCMQVFWLVSTRPAKSSLIVSSIEMERGGERKKKDRPELGEGKEGK